MATFSYQDRLPSLPVPDLDVTLDKYLKSATLLLSPEEERRTRKNVEDFRKSAVAKTLQTALINKSKKDRNWIEDWWYDAYLETRVPLIPFSSLGSYNPNTPRGPPEEQIPRSADVMHHLMQYWMKIRRQEIPQTKSRGIPWDMHQYYVLYNSNRTPGLPKDRMDRYFKSASEGSCPSNVIVLCRGALWSVEMIVDGEVRSPDDLVRILRHIEMHSPNVSHSPATLTTEHRDAWAKYHKELLEVSERNRKSIATIEQAAFALTLAEDTAETPLDVLTYSMHGRHNAQWADKCMNTIMLRDCQMAFQADHSNVDAIVVLDATDKVGPQMRKHKWTPKETGLTDLPERLEFDLTPSIVDGINQAEKNFEKLAGSFRVQTVDFQGYGNAFFRNRKLYTDTFVQIALQLAFFKVHKSFAPIYETASTRKYYHGRTETVRGRTAELIKFGRAVFEGKQKSEQLALLKTAYDAHNKLMADATDGQGIDRHLYGLKKTLQELNKSKCSPPLPMPELFTDPAFSKSGGNGNFLLSTSFIGYNDTGSYGYVCAMLADGYGTFYKIHQNSILLTCTDYANTKSDLDAYCKAIPWALEHVGSLLPEPSNL